MDSSRQHDCRLLFDPEDEIPDWFWDFVHQGRQQADVFRQVLMTADPEQFAEAYSIFNEVAGFFVELPFDPPPPVKKTENSLEETGHWVVSQGKDYFFKVWNQPEFFWKLMEENVIATHPEQNFYEVMASVWYERFPNTEIPD